MVYAFIRIERGRKGNYCSSDLAEILILHVVFFGQLFLRFQIDMDNPILPTKEFVVFVIPMPATFLANWESVRRLIEIWFTALVR